MALDFRQFRTLEQAATALRIAPEWLVSLASDGYAPHVRIGDQLFFKMSDLRAWAEQNLLKACPGRPLPKPTVHVVSGVAGPAAEIARRPLALRAMERLEEIDMTSTRMGVYFLCRQAEEVVYIGKSIDVLRRVPQHSNDKDFDRVFFLPWPAANLEDLEGHLIREIKPARNVSGGARPKDTLDPELRSVVSQVRAAS